MTHNESNYTDIASSYGHPEQSHNIQSYTEFIFVAIYCIIFVLGFFPNAIVTYLIFTRKFMRVKYIFTASIAIAHMLFCVVCIPLILLGLSRFVRPSSNDIARACQVIVFFIVSVTSMSMLATAVRRSLALSERYRYANFTYRGKVKNIIGIWIVSLAISLPFICIEDEHMSLFDLTEYKSRHLELYNSKDATPLSYHIWLNESSNVSISNGNESTTVIKDNPKYCFMNMFIYSVIISSIIIIIHVFISFTLQSITLCGIKKRPNQVHWLKEIMITKQHLTMLVIFFLCWAPLSVVIVTIRTASYHVTDWFLKLLELLAASFVMYNPVLYYFLNAHIRRELKMWLRSVNNFLTITP